MYRLRIFLRAMKRNQQLKNVLRNLVKNGTDRTKLRPIYVKRGDVPKPYIYITYIPNFALIFARECLAHFVRSPIM